MQLFVRQGSLVERDAARSSNVMSLVGWTFVSATANQDVCSASTHSYRIFDLAIVDS
jgi:hypothetical protein